jgi:hypothetical protein
MHSLFYQDYWHKPPNGMGTKVLPVAGGSLQQVDLQWKPRHTGAAGLSLRLRCMVDICIKFRPEEVPDWLATAVPL